MAYDAEVMHLNGILGGRRQYVEGMTYFVTCGNEEDQERVTLWSHDGAGLAAALRRAADEIENADKSPFNLPPVTVPMGPIE